MPNRRRSPSHAKHAQAAIDDDNGLLVVRDRMIMQPNPQIFPQEILVMVLQNYMDVFFETPWDPSSHGPVILRVCHLWRSLTIDDSRCWTRLSLAIPVDLNYIRGNTTNRKTRARAIQDTVNLCFARAQGRPIRLTVQFYRDCESSRDNPNLLAWLAQCLPNLEEYNELPFDNFQPILPRMSETIATDRFQGLTRLYLDAIDYSSSAQHLHFPDLRILVLRERRGLYTFLPVAPKLVKLAMGKALIYNEAFMLDTLTGLRLYPELTDLSMAFVQNRDPRPGSLEFHERPGIKRLNFFIGLPGFCLHELMLRLPGITELTTDERLPLELFPELARGMDVFPISPNITRLTITNVTDGEVTHLAARLPFLKMGHRAHRFLDAFPKLVYLCLGGLLRDWTTPFSQPAGR